MLLLSLLESEQKTEVFFFFLFRGYLAACWGRWCLCAFRSRKAPGLISNARSLPVVVLERDASPVPAQAEPPAQFPGCPVTDTATPWTRPAPDRPWTHRWRSDNTVSDPTLTLGAHMRTGGTGEASVTGPFLHPPGTLVCV